MIRLIDRMAALRPSVRGAVALAAGALTALGLPPLGAWPLAFAGVPLFLLALEAVKPARWHSGFGTGWLFGLGYFAVAFHWIGFAFLIEAETYLWMMPFMLGALAGGMAIYWGLAAMLARRLGGRGLPLALSCAASLGGAEWLRGHLFTGFPWAAPGLMADGMGGLAQAASLIGMTGLTVLVLLWAALPYALLRERRAAGLVTVAAAFLLLPALWGWGTMRLAGAPSATVPGVSLRIVQPNVPQQQKWREDNARPIFDTLKRLSAMATADRPDGIAGITHLVWPESAVPFFIDESPVARDELRPMLGGRTALITGALRVERTRPDDPDVFNSIIVFVLLLGIAENFRKAHALRKVADELSALDNPNADDRRILGEAETTATKLERAGAERVRLIGQCATEAKFIDESLRNERKEARTAEQRAELHSTLSAMLYGIEATPKDTSTDSAADAVIARVQAYREIKNQIQLAREDEVR